MANFPPFDVTKVSPEELNDIVSCIHAPLINSIWIHKNGNFYVVREIRNLDPDRQHEYPTTVCYDNLFNGRKFARALYNWYRSMVHTGFSLNENDEIVRSQ